METFKSSHLAHSEPLRVEPFRGIQPWILKVSLSKKVAISSAFDPAFHLADGPTSVCWQLDGWRSCGHIHNNLLSVMTRCCAAISWFWLRATGQGRCPLFILPRHLSSWNPVSLVRSLWLSHPILSDQIWSSLHEACAPLRLTNAGFWWEKSLKLKINAWVRSDCTLDSRQQCELLFDANSSSFCVGTTFLHQYSLWCWAWSNLRL